MSLNNCSKFGVAITLISWGVLPYSFGRTLTIKLPTYCEEIITFILNFRWHHYKPNIICQIFRISSILDKAYPNLSSEIKIDEISWTVSCRFHGPSIISAASNVVFWTFKTSCVVCHAYCFCYGGIYMARKHVWKTTFHSTFKMIQL